MSTTTRRGTLAATALVTALVAGVTSNAAQAHVVRPEATQPHSQRAGTSGTIVYVKGHNVWIARGDGTHAHRVTKDGTASRSYRSPSESDGGVIAAAVGTTIVRMSQSGKVLDRIDPPMLRDSAGAPMDGTVNEVSISPNGKVIAYGYVRYSCPVGADCLVRYATGYTLATKRKAAGRATYFHDASWASNGRTLLTGGYGSQVMVHDVTRAPVHWFDDSDYAGDDTDLSDGELSPNGRWFAAIRGYSDSSAIAWYHVVGNARTGTPPRYPDIVCLTPGDVKHAGPTWSPDSTAIAFAGKGGITIQRSAISPDCSGGVPARLALPGGTEPDWSRAPLR